MITNLGIFALTVSSAIVVCVVPVLYLIKTCAKRVIVVPQTQNINSNDTNDHNDEHVDSSNT